MKRFVLFATLSLALVFAVSALAGDRVTEKVMVKGGYGMLYGGTLNAAKDTGDTTYMIGGPGSYTGKFETAGGSPSWQGWTTKDITLGGGRWNVSDYNVPTGGGSYAMWCGEVVLDDCGTGDFAGYKNNYNENLEFHYTVANAGIPTTMNLSALVNWDSEPGYDYFLVQYNRGGTWEDVLVYDGQGIDQAIAASVTFNPDDYVGDGLNEAQIRFRGSSDGGWSDEDCLWPTMGLAQVDNIVLDVVGRAVFSENFEDQVSDDWNDVVAQNVGDFAQLWVGLEDLDPCRTNYSTQVAFIDDGVVVDGTGGYFCTSFCYGPSGFIVNPEGGLAGASAHIQNWILSPVVAWPANADAAYIQYEVYRHETMSGGSPGIFYVWGVRSITGNDPAIMPAAAWADRNFVYFGGPDYIRDNQVVTDLLLPGRTYVQMSMGIYELGWVWGVEGTDGTPAHYFDNVVFVAYPYAGPAMATREIDIANDGFPDRGTIDYGTLANNWIRFDMANNIAPNADLRNDPGDSITCDVAVVRNGATLNGLPKMVVKMRANPLFDGVRVLPAGFTQTGNIIDGEVLGDSTYNASGALVQDRYNWDLPDSNFFFPGDVIQYYFHAEDDQSGDIGVSTVPGDISDFGNFDPLAYSSSFTVRGLPTMFDAVGNQPKILFWNDFANRGGENEWYFALGNLGYLQGIDYDTYYTNGPSSGVGDGLGGRATSQTLAEYEVLLYTVGDLSTNTISNNDYNNDASADLTVLDNWFQQGGKSAFMTGDDLAYSMTQAGAQALAFSGSYFSVRFNDQDVADDIGGQVAPTVVPIAGNSVFTTVDEWIAFGGCLGINTFDNIEASGTAERLAEFTTPGGVPGAYTFAAATRYNNVADVILMPYDFMFIYNTPGYVPSTPGLSARAEILQDVLVTFGCLPGPEPPIGVPDADVFAVSNYPNPFNPATTIKLNLPKAGEVSLKVFNVRGELVRTLVDGPMVAGQHSIEWNGTNDQGSQVASGVYFYETRTPSEVKVNKMALVK
jgi:hypothetical protein